MNDDKFMRDVLKMTAAINTTAASPLTLFLAQVFGEKKTHTDSDGTVTIAKWRGKYYFLDHKVNPEPKP